MAFEQILTPYAPQVRSIVRIVAALLFLEHGTSGLFGWPSPLPTPALLSMYWFAGAIELVGGALLALGLFTRPVALIMSGEMAFAYFISHAPSGFFPILNRGDADDFSRGILPVIANFVGDQEWGADLKSLGEDYFFSLNRYVFVGYNS